MHCALAARAWSPPRRRHSTGMSDAVSRPIAPSSPTSRRSMARGAVLWGNLGWHPAAEALSALRGEPAGPEVIEVLRGGNESATYRLAGVGTRGGAAIRQHGPARRRAL